MRTIAALFALLSTTALIGCSSEGGARDDAAPSIRGDVRTASPTPAAKTTQAATGKTQTMNVQGYTTSVTVYGYRQPLHGEYPPDRSGYVFAGVDVRMCVKASPGGVPVEVSADPWSLSYADDTAVEVTWADPESFTVPIYPQDYKAVPLGDCVRGWVVFEVPKTKRPAQTMYTPTGTEVPTQPLRWTIR